MTVTGHTITADQIRHLRDNGPRTIEYLNACDMALAALRGEFGAGKLAAIEALAFCSQAVNVAACNAHRYRHPRHVADSCNGDCCTECGGPIDENDECRCEGQRDFPPGEHPARYGAS